jgi:serine/threonine protein kinase
VDLYSVGIVMLEMLNGRVPSGFDEIESLILLIPEPLGEIVREATKYHSKDRFISAETMIDALRKFTNEA